MCFSYTPVNVLLKITFLHLDYAEILCTGINKQTKTVSNVFTHLSALRLLFIRSRGNVYSLCESLLNHRWPHLIRIILRFSTPENVAIDNRQSIVYYDKLPLPETPKITTKCPMFLVPCIFWYNLEEYMYKKMV